MRNKGLKELLNFNNSYYNRQVSDFFWFQVASIYFITTLSNT